MKEEEEVDMCVYDRLYKVDVYTGESGINAKVSKNVLFIKTDVTSPFSTVVYDCLCHVE